MFLSLDFLYVSAKEIDAAIRHYTEQLGGELVWKIHPFDAPDENIYSGKVASAKKSKVVVHIGQKLSMVCFQPIRWNRKNIPV
jgi:hypothetical protein